MASAGAVLARVVASGGGLPWLGDPVLAISKNPLNWLGDGVTKLASDGWRAAMTAIWSSGLWVLRAVFMILDAVMSPDLSAGGPMGQVYMYTFAIGAMVATIMALVQLGVALVQRDGKSLARLLIGVAQFYGVWVGYVAYAAALVAATSGLTKGLLQALLGIDAFGMFDSSASWPRKVNDTVVATVLGLSTVTLIWPASIMFLLIMFARAAALIVLIATSPIAAGGLAAEATRSWFWKTQRWFFAALSIPPLTALVLGIGVKINEGVVSGAGDKTVAAVGMALTGSVLYLVGAICPLLLFRLLSFVDPGTSSGMAMRQSLAAAGGITGLLGGGGAGGAAATATAGSGAATKHDGQGRSQGESSADSATQSRFGSALSTAGSLALKGATAIPALAGKASSIGSDVLGSAGVGHQQPYFGQGEYGGGSGATPGGTAAAPTRNGGGDNATPGGDDPGRGDDNGQPPDGGGGLERSGSSATDDQGVRYAPPPPPPPPPPPAPRLRGTRRNDRGGPSPDSTAA